jgi:hypothetical protein
VDQNEGDYLGTLLSDSVVVMLIDAAQFRCRPGEQGAADYSIQVQRQTHSWLVRVSLQRERRTPYHY